MCCDAYKHTTSYIHIDDDGLDIIPADTSSATDILPQLNRYVCVLVVYVVNTHNFIITPYYTHNYTLSHT